MTRTLRVLRTLTACLAVLFWSVAVFLPMPRTSSDSEVYLCAWSDGTETEIGYFEACRDLYGMDGDGILLRRGELTGVVGAGSACLAAVETLETGGLERLLQTNVSLMTELERAALYRRYRARLYFAGGFFGWTGERFERTGAGGADELVLLAGAIPRESFVSVGAKTVQLRAAAEFSASLLAGTQVERVFAEYPYSANGDAVCIFSTGGTRLIAGMPLSRAVHVPAETEFADEGALLPCQSLEEVELPFLGNSANAFGTGYRGEFAYLFSSEEGYFVPATLKKVRVTGGAIVSHAFYACGTVEEIDACGVPWDRIGQDAFSDCTGLRLLHSPRRDVELSGSFTRRTAPCGCTVFVRAD